MTKRVLAISAAVAVASFLQACGSSTNGPTPLPTPTPVTRAQVSMVVDPNPVLANYEGNGWYRFKVNLGFAESAGVGCTIRSVRTTITSAISGGVLLDDVSTIPSSISRIPAGSTNTLQFTSPRYHMEGGSSSGAIAFSISILDDRGNSITLNGQASILHHGEPRQLP